MNALKSLSACVILSLAAHHTVSHAFAGELPPPSVPESFGVNVSGHELDEVDYELMTELGARWVRRGILWTQLENQRKGEFDFTEADAFLDELAEHDLGLLCVVAFGNPLYEPGQHWMGVRTPEGRAGFANYAARLADRYKDRKIVYEIWNESNSAFWKPVEDPNQYMDMLDVAVPAMREADPDCVVLAPSLYHIGWDKARDWLEVCLQRGLLDKVDGFAFHSYGDRGRNSEVERNLEWAAEVRELLERHGAPADFPFVQTEYGINQNAPEFRDQPEERWETLQAQSVTRNYLVCLMFEMPINIHYEWKSRDESTRGDKGLLNRDKTTTAAYDAFKTLLVALDGLRFDRRIDGFGEDTYVTVFDGETGDEPRLAIWTTGATREVVLPISGTDSVEIWEMLGDRRELEVSDGELVLEATPAPIYVGLRGGTLTDG